MGFSCAKNSDGLEGVWGCKLGKFSAQISIWIEILQIKIILILLKFTENLYVKLKLSFAFCIVLKGTGLEILKSTKVLPDLRD